MTRQDDQVFPLNDNRIIQAALEYFSRMLTPEEVGRLIGQEIAAPEQYQAVRARAQFLASCRLGQQGLELLELAESIGELFRAAHFRPDTTEEDDGAGLYHLEGQLSIAHYCAIVNLLHDLKIPLGDHHDEQRDRLNRARQEEEYMQTLAQEILAQAELHHQLVTRIHMGAAGLGFSPPKEIGEYVYWLRWLPGKNGTQEAAQVYAAELEELGFEPLPPQDMFS